MELRLPNGRTRRIRNADELRSGLSKLGKMSEGDVIELFATGKHSIRAIRDDELWSVTVKKRGWWFRQPLTTGDWIDFSKRKKKPFWVPRGDLSDAKVLTVFCEFFEGKSLSQPIAG